MAACAAHAGRRMAVIRSVHMPQLHIVALHARCADAA
jgi:hypothetical protein